MQTTFSWVCAHEYYINSIRIICKNLFNSVTGYNKNSTEVSHDWNCWHVRFVFGPRIFSLSFPRFDGMSPRLLHKSSSRHSRTNVFENSIFHQWFEIQDDLSLDFMRIREIYQDIWRINKHRWIRVIKWWKGNTKWFVGSWWVSATPNSVIYRRFILVFFLISHRKWTVNKFISRTMKAWKWSEVFIVNIHCNNKSNKRYQNMKPSR